MVWTRVSTTLFFPFTRWPSDGWPFINLSPGSQVSWQNTAHARIIFSHFPNPLAHPLPISSQYVCVRMHLHIHLYACDHNALYSLSTKHMSVYWTRYWSTFHYQHSTQEGGRLEDSTHLQQKEVQLSASHSHHEICSWHVPLCEVVWMNHAVQRHHNRVSYHSSHVPNLTPHHNTSTDPLSVSEVVRHRMRYNHVQLSPDTAHAASSSRVRRRCTKT